MADLRSMTTSEADAFRDGLRRGVELALEAAARECDAEGERADTRFGHAWGGAYHRHCAAAIRALDVATLVPGE